MSCDEPHAPSTGWAAHREASEEITTEKSLKRCHGGAPHPPAQGCRMEPCGIILQNEAGPSGGMLGRWMARLRAGSWAMLPRQQPEPSGPLPGGGQPHQIPLCGILRNDVQKNVS